MSDLFGTTSTVIVPTFQRKGMLRVLSCLLSATALLGLYTSFRYHFSSWGLDPDSMQSGIFWLGIKEHGLDFIRTWGFSFDNWLLSLYLPTMPLYVVVGIHPIVVSGLGWIAFVASAVIAFFMANILAGRIAALGVAAAILMANAHAIGEVGFMSAPADHDISMAWGLVVFLLFYFFQGKGAAIALVAAAVILAADCISDPWAVVGVALPVLIGAAVGCFTQNRLRSAMTIAGTLLAIIAAQTKLLGTLGFLPSFPVSIGNFAQIDANFAWLARGLAIIFNLVTGMQQSFVIPSVISCCALAAAFGWGSYVLLMRNKKRPAELSLVVTIIFSAVLPCGAFIVTDFPQPPGLYVARFAVSLTILAPLIAISALSDPASRRPTAAAIGIPAFFILVGLSGLYGGSQVWAAPWRGMATDGVTDLAQFLEGHDLTYGYGEYWGALANSVTLVSRGAVTMRPVIFDPKTGHISPRGVGGASLWYSASDLPKREGKFFVAFRNDGENCSSVDLCAAGVQRQFGQAAETYSYDGITILAFDHAIIVQ